MDKRLIFILAIFVICIFAGLTVLSSAKIKTIPINDTNITEDGEY